MNRVRIIALLALALILSACGGSPAAAPSTAAEMPNQGEVAPAASSGGAANALEAYDARQPAGAGQPATQGQSGAPNSERLVIKTADLALQVESARDAEARLRALVSQLGGYVVKVETTGADADMTARVTFRVPPARFDDALAGAQGLATKLLSRTVSGDDVTEEFVDLSPRLRNLEATRDRLLTFLEKAENVEDALKVNESLTQIQGEIEQLKGRQQFLQQSAALSTITVFLSPVPVTAILTEEGWQPATVARRALRNLVEFGQGLAELVIVLLIWAPVWLPLLLAGWWLLRRARRLRRQPVATPPSNPEAA
ncbi:hypothetical protein SE17_07790 [Kouleothrix aurantiaca]|uniref:DUF4349 domain-containing protein n=1 Tax=Kouleothrix aurantiaca TaxID=186479 RepID=A0A0P9FAP9_9CHLR|nr:hypothetical protein SE17_07790 [Kouleothrix aurantiaca]